MGRGELEASAHAPRAPSRPAGLENIRVRVPDTTRGARLFIKIAPPIIGARRGHGRGGEGARPPASWRWRVQDVPVGVRDPVERAAPEPDRHPHLLRQRGRGRQRVHGLPVRLHAHSSLDRWLHPGPSDVRKRKHGSLSLVQRLGIAMDIADTRCYLHNSCDPPIVHCDVKPGSVLLGDDMTARISAWASPSCCSSTPLEAPRAPSASGAPSATSHQVTTYCSAVSATLVPPSRSLDRKNSCAWCAVQSTARRGATDSPSWRSFPGREGGGLGYGTMLPEFVVAAFRRGSSSG